MGINPVGTWATADFETQTGTPYKTALDNDLAVAERIARSFAPHAKATPDMNVLVDPGAVFNDNAFTEKTQQTAGPFTAPVSNPRIDRVVVDNLTGVASIIAGAEAGSPVAPAIPDEKTPICQVALTVGQVAITNAHITDERIGGTPSSVIIKNRVTADVTVVSTAAETDLYPYSVPAGLLGTNKMLDLLAVITELDIPSGDNTILRAKFGATTLATFTIQGGGGGITNGIGTIHLQLFADGATNAQVAVITVTITDGAGTVVFNEMRLGTASIDSTAAQDLKITADHSASSVNNNIVLGHAHLRKE